MDILLLILGLVVLVVGGDFLVKGASGIALKMNVEPMVVGLTVVSLGTSAPELIVSLNSALSGQADIALGNVVGSNIANLGLVLGLTAIIFPIAVGTKVLRVDWPVLVLFSGLVYTFGYDNEIVRWEGAVLFTILIGYIYMLLKRGKTNPDEAEVEDLDTKAAEKSSWQLIGFIFLGMVALYFGADWFLKGGVSLGKSFGLSEKIIGVTIIAFGTSAPELAASVIAAYRKETDIALGNLVGSNIFNIGAVLGLTSMIQPLNTDASIMSFDVYFMLGTAIILFPLMIFRKRLSIPSGLILFSVYVVFIYFQLAG